MALPTMVALQTRVKILGATSAVDCEVLNCGHPARFLFRSGEGRIRAYCAQHAAAAAGELGVELPDPAKREARPSWRGWSRTA